MCLLYVLTIFYYFATTDKLSDGQKLTKKLPTKSLTKIF